MNDDDDLDQRVAYWAQVSLATGTLLFLASAWLTWWVFW